MELHSIRPLDNSSELNRMVNRLFGLPPKGYVEVGCTNTLMPENYQLCQKSISEFEVFDDDVFILGYPKSGTRWTQEMVWLIFNDLDYDRAKKVDLEYRFPMIELDGITFLNLNMMQSILEMKRPRLLKSHLHWSLLPEDIKSRKKQPKFIVVLRAPEDVCLSQFHHHSTTHDFKGTFEDYCTLFLAGKVPLGPYWTQILSIWEQRNTTNMLILKYKELKEDLPSVIRKIAAFLDKNVSDEEMPKLLEHLSFDSLKNNPAFNNEELLRKNNNKDCNPFVRKGIVGGHKTVMSSDMIEKFKKMKEKMFGGTGLSFD